MTESKDLVAPQGDQTLKDSMAEVARFMTSGDLSRLPKATKDAFIVKLAEQIGIPPYPPPFAFVTDKRGKETLVPQKHLAQALRDKHGISTEITYQGPLQLGDKFDESIYVVKMKGTLPSGRFAEEMGTGFFGGDSAVGRGKADEVLKTVTKAANRVTYSLLGIGLIDETEVDSLRDRGLVREEPRQVKPQLREMSSSSNVVDAQNVVVLDPAQEMPVSGSPIKNNS